MNYQLPMAKNREIGQENFEKLLNWLNSDRELAGIRYETIRLRLMKFFALKGCQGTDELTDITIDIVVQKIDSIMTDYKGDSALYFYGVAKNVVLKYKNSSQIELSPHLTQQNNREDEYTLQKHRCLESSLKALKQEDRELITAYYQESKGAKIKLRKSLADQRGVSGKNLRVYVHRLKEILEKSIRQCMENNK